MGKTQYLTFTLAYKHSPETKTHTHMLLSSLTVSPWNLSSYEAHTAPAKGLSQLLLAQNCIKKGGSW